MSDDNLCTECGQPDYYMLYDGTLKQYTPAPGHTFRCTECVNKRLVEINKNRNPGLVRRKGITSD